MPPSALCGSYVCNIRKTVVRDEFLGSISADQIRVQFSYLNWPGINNHFDIEGSRFETIASWQRSVLEHRRQLIKLNSLDETSRQILAEARELWLEKKEELVRLFISMIDFIDNQGDWSLEQFKHYAVAHKKRGTGYKKITWGSIVRDQEKLDAAYQQYYKLVRDLLALLRDEAMYDGEHTIHPKWTYPALRSRPGSISEQSYKEGVGDVLLSKYRDRAAGGVYGLSQLFWPIFRADLKRDLAKMLLSAIAQLTKLTMITPEVDGSSAYLKFFSEDPHNLVVCDTSLAERLEAQISDLPTAANLSIQGFPKQFGYKKFSGIAPTRTDQYVTEPFLILACIKLGFISKPSHLYYGGDNWGWPACEPLPEKLFNILSPSSRWLGHNPEMQAISGFKLTVDNTDRAENWSSGQTKLGFNQYKSGVVRLTRNLIGMNLIPDLMTLPEFLNKVVIQSGIDTIELHEGAPYHHLLDDPVMAKALIDHSPELEDVCRSVFEIAQKMNVPYKLIDDVKSPIEPSWQKVK
jgi:hypothetical protein